METCGREERQNEVTAAGGMCWHGGRVAVGRGEVWPVSPALSACPPDPRVPVV